MNFTDPSGFCIGAECGWEAGQMAMQAAATQAASQMAAMAAAQASAMGAAAASQAASAAAAAQAEAFANSNAIAEQYAINAVMQQGSAVASEQAQRAVEQARARALTSEDVARQHDLATNQPYTTPANPNGLNNGPPMGPNWTGYLAENGAGGTTSQNDAGKQGTSANGQPTPYMETTPAWLAVAASMCLLPEVNGAIKLWKLGNEVDRFVESTVGAKEVTIVQRGGNTIYQSTADALNRSTGMNLSRGRWGEAVESLKGFEGYSNNFHGNIDSLGNYINPKTGEVIGNLLDFVP